MVTNRSGTARLAGGLYLSVIVTGMFVMFYAPARLYVPGDTPATAARILAHEGLFRAQQAVALVSELLFIALALVLHRLLVDVDRRHAKLMVGIVLLTAPLAFLSVAFGAGTLGLLRDAEVLAAFEPRQRDALALLLLQVEQDGLPVTILLWGAWLPPLGQLVRRSGFLPSLLGAWLIVNGLAYAAIGVAGLLFAQGQQAVSFFARPLLLGELVFALWLVTRGVRPPPLHVPGAIAGGARP
jgi:hypothetical protein